MIDVRQDHLDCVLGILAERAPDCDAWAFGSRVDGGAVAGSDLDLVLEGDRTLDWRVMARLKDAFEESSLPFRVDVLDWHALPEHFRQNILKKRETLRKRNGRTTGIDSC